jgi:pimeloyl-ACP methyl ester carboxylesterase
VDFLTTDTGRRIAYVRDDGAGPGIVFLGGLKSDMSGTKALHLQNWAHAQGRAFLRFDYSGHGASDGAFTDGCIGDWAGDAVSAINVLTQGPQVLVGSSMGGWICLIMAAKSLVDIAGIVGIAPAPDFTEDGFWAGFSLQQKAVLAAKGQVALPSEYGEPYIITQRLIEDGRAHLVLRAPLHLPFPVRFLLGTCDNSVPAARGQRLIEHASGDDIRLTLVKGADHSFSTPPCLKLIENSIYEVSAG